MIENFVFEKSGLNSRVFLKEFFTSYLCILFIKYCALRSFCIKLLCFSKNWFFPKFQLIEPISQPIEIVIKGLVWVCVFRSVLDCYWISWRYFRSIESNFRSIKNHIESFLKTFVSLVFFIIQTFFKTLILSLFDRSKGQNKIFVVFDQIFFKGFCHLRPVRPLYPSFFIYFHVSCILGRMLNLWKFGDFDNLSLFFHNWLMGFCCGMLLNFSLVFNSINLMNWENFNFSRAWKYPILGFCSIEL